MTIYSTILASAYTIGDFHVSGSKPQPLIKNNKNKSNNIEAKTLLPNSSVLLESTPTSPVVIVTASMGQTYTNITTSSLLSLSTSPVQPHVWFGAKTSVSIGSGWVCRLSDRELKMPGSLHPFCASWLLSRFLLM